MEENILEPCITCRHERATVTGARCPVCYKEELTRIVLGKNMI